MKNRTGGGANLMRGKYEKMPNVQTRAHKKMANMRR
jgi:hypothetical protein